MEWYVPLLLECLLMTIPFFGINFYEEKTKNVSWRHAVQRKVPKGFEREEASVIECGILHMTCRIAVYYFGFGYNLFDLSFSYINIIAFIIKMIVGDGLGTLLHQWQHTKYGAFSNHDKHHLIRSPTYKSSAYISLGELFFSSHVPWLVTGLMPIGAFWDQALLLCIGATLQRLSHSEFDHPWEYWTIFHKLGLIGTRDHHVHHLFPNKNFADLFIIWDNLLGTYLDPKSVKGINPMYK